MPQSLNNFDDHAFEYRKQGMEALLDVFDDTCESSLAIDKKGKIIWISDQYVTRLNKMKIEKPLGKMIEEVVPNSLLRQVAETEKPILLDLMRLGKEWTLTTRVPLFDEDGKCFGAMGFILMNNTETLKPLLTKIERLQNELSNTQRKLASTRQSKYTFSNFVGKSKSVRELKLHAHKAAHIESPILLLGETGTGKELLAHAIHGASMRGNGPFVSLNVAAIPENLLEAEFFGTAPGAYTGADKKGRDGKLVLAAGGTLFLDEIGDMPLQVQSKLLRVLQEKEFEPVGSNKVIKTDLRIVAATSRDLPKMVHEGDFRADLYYRLNVVPLHVPPLRQRLEDIPVLCSTILDKIALPLGMDPFDMSDDALSICAAYNWPGNVRELHNVLERVTTMATTHEITAKDITSALPIGGISQNIATPIAGSIVRPLDDIIQETERKAIEDALLLTGNNKAKASSLLKISRGRLYDKMKSLGIAH